jgi:hypothetical protein
LYSAHNLGCNGYQSDPPNGPEEGDLNMGKTWISVLIGNDSVWFWTMIQCLAVLGSLCFIARQIYHQRSSNMLATLFSLDERWKSASMVLARDHICRDYLFAGTEKTIAQPEELVMCFFEEIGIYVRKGIFDVTTVWEFYSYYIEHYWVILQPRVKEYRINSQDQLWFSEFEYLYSRITKYSIKRKCPVGKSDADIQKFVRGEIGQSSTPSEVVSSGT